MHQSCRKRKPGIRGIQKGSEKRMKKYIYKKVDAFTSGSSKGNPAAFMFLGEEQFDEQQFLAIAKEHAGFICEFVFVKGQKEDMLKLTYYSSECEVDFCGHGTIATMYEIIKNDSDLLSKKEITFATNKKGILTAYNYISDEDAVYISAPKAIFYECNIGKKVIAKALQLTEDKISDNHPISIIDAGLKTLIVPINDFKTEVSVYPDIECLKQFVIDNEIDIVLIWCKDSEKDSYFAHTRVFSPKYGYLEDPATGSGNSAFANYLLKNGYWDGEPIAVEQGGDSIEFNKVNLRTLGDKVLFGGSATLKIEGNYYI